MRTISVARNVLLRGLDDWVMACEVVSEIVEAGVDVNDESVPDLSFQILEQVILNGWMEAGDVTGDGFVPWEIAPSEALVIIKAEWRKLDQLPNLGDVCWLRNTTLGDYIALGKAYH